MWHAQAMYTNWGIYVHVPWCRRRCPYCDFYLEVGRAEATFSEELLGEFEERRPLWPTKPASTLYFGGGTPSVLPIEQLRAFMGKLDLAPQAEITLEANPEDVTQDLVAAWREAGVNRISLGIQSFDDAILKQLGRKHRAQGAWDAISACIEGGISRLSVDLIYGVPSEDSQTIYANIQRLSEMGVGQVSAYLLTVEAGTALEKHIRSGRSKPTSDDDQAQAFEDLQRVMERHGFRQYEVSSFAKPGEESRHNRNYWGKGPYLGLGPSAHSMRILECGGLERSQNRASLKEWQAGAQRLTEVLPSAYALLESIAFGLRDLLGGVELGVLALKHRCQVPQSAQQALERAIGKGWVLKVGGIYSLTQLGVRFSDAVARDILDYKP
jgi:oxygen-independent coproporphyrinogen-3 oxidase